MSNRLASPINTFAVLVLSLFLCLSTAGIAFSQDTYTVPQTADVTLAWDANDPAPDGYRIYQRTENTSYDYTQPVWTGADTSGTVYNLGYDTTYYFVVRAYAGTLESADSEEVSYNAPSPQTPTYSITASAGENGAISPSGTQTVDEGADQTFSITANSGYRIADVTVDGVSQGAIASYTFSAVAADHTIHAAFEADNYTITATSGTNGSISPAGSISVATGQNLTFVISPDAGYHVTNVVVDGTAVGPTYAYTFTNVDQDHSIVASFALDTYEITATAGANGSITPPGVTDVTYGATQSYAIVPADGYHIADVVVDGSTVGPVSAYTFGTIRADHTIHATFAIDVHTIVATAGTGGDVTPAGETEVSSGGSQIYTITADDGYQIADVLVDGASMGALETYTFTNVNGSHSLSATFVEAGVVSIQLEAEDGDLYLPMEIADDETASAGGYVWVADNSEDVGGTAEYHVDIPVAGDYVVWGRLIANGTDSDSVRVSVDGQAEMIWYVQISEDEAWTWDVVSARDAAEPRVTTDPQRFALSAGTHTFRFAAEEAGLKLDRLLITNQTDLVNPDGNALIESIEFGDLQIDHKWTRVNFTKAFVDPVVVAGPITLEGGQPGVVRIRNVDPTGFEIRVQEWDYLDGWHMIETVSYMVMEAGSYTLADGTKVEAANTTTTAGASFKSVAFNTAFNVVPVIMTSLTSFNDAAAVSGRMRNVSAEGFRYRMQEQDANTQDHGAETLSYIAWEPAAGTVGDTTYVVAKTDNVVDHNTFTVNYPVAFETAPILLADMQTLNGGDNASLRCRNRGLSSVEVLVDEEQSLDDETWHVTEVVGYFAFVR